MATGRWVRGILLGALLLCAGAVLGIGAAATREGMRYAGRIYPGVAVGGIALGGLTPLQATAALQSVADRRLGSPFLIRLADHDATFIHAEVGLRGRVRDAVDAAYAVGRTGPPWQRLRGRFALARQGIHLPLPFDHDANRLHRLLAALALELDARAQDAAVTVRDGAVELVARSRPGQTLDVEATATRVVAALGGGVSQVEAVLTVVAPAFTTEDAAGLRTLLAAYTTKMAANADRTHNIALASGFIRGVLLPPDGVFSYNKTVGPRTLERGFREAPVLLDDELVPGDGGGVCQVSSTLFNVALLADFKILSRTNHSRPVAYLPAGRDATVVYGALDLLFRNTTGRHVLLWTEVRGSRLTISAFGTHAEDKEVAILVEDRRVIPAPEGTVTKKDPRLAVGKVVIREAQPGLRVRTYRVITVDGLVARREYIGVSYYRPVPRTMKVGTKALGAAEPRR
jgi:vancomycin resistance protein YoaR